MQLAREPGKAAPASGNIRSRNAEEHMVLKNCLEKSLPEQVLADHKNGKCCVYPSLLFCLVSFISISLKVAASCTVWTLQHHHFYMY